MFARLKGERGGGGVGEGEAIGKCTRNTVCMKEGGGGGSPSSRMRGRWEDR